MKQSKRPLGRPKKKAHEKSTKEIILNVATNMFLEKAYPLVSMDDVAHKSNITKATVYYYYQTKADLFTDAMVQLMLRVSQNIEDIFSKKIPLKEQLMILAKDHLKATNDIDINTFMREAKLSLSEGHQACMLEAENKIYTALENGLKKAMHKGEVPESNAHLAALLFISMLTTGKSNRETFTSLDELVRQIVHFFWYGLAYNS